MKAYRLLLSTILPSIENANSIFENLSYYNSFPQQCVRIIIHTMNVDFAYFYKKNQKFAIKNIRKMPYFQFLLYIFMYYSKYNRDVHTIENYFLLSMWLSALH